MTKAETLYQQFTETKQEALRLSAALTGFFLSEGVTDGQREAYAAYIRRRIRPAAEVLIREEDTEKLAVLEEQGWISETEVEALISMARKLGKTASLVWLLHLKNEKYGFIDKKYEL